VLVLTASTVDAGHSQRDEGVFFKSTFSTYTYSISYVAHTHVTSPHTSQALRKVLCKGIDEALVQCLGRMLDPTYLPIDADADSAANADEDGSLCRVGTDAPNGLEYVGDPCRYANGSVYM
jgi:hypothetical protein